MIDTTDALLDGVIEQNSVCLRQLLTLLRPLCLRHLRSRLGRNPHDAGDILDEGESLLFEWSAHSEPRRLLPRGEPLGRLAWRLMREVLQRRARQERRHREIAASVAATADFDREVPRTPLGLVSNGSLASSLHCRAPSARR